MEGKKGKLIVIEGGDGSGKATQSGLLLAYLSEKKIPHMSLDFPNYESFFGKMIGQFLRGEYGPLDSVSPYLAALLFALDRKLVKEHIISALHEGKIIVANRYVSSNIAHQGSKIKNPEERAHFISWLKQLEFEVHGLPAEDAIIFLHVPWQTAKELTTKKNERSYLNGGKEDIQEANLTHRQETEMMYTELSQNDPRWITISCMEHDTIKKKDVIHHEIVRALQNNHLF